MSVETVGDVIEDSDGAITGTWTCEGLAPMAGASGGPYAAAAGAIVSWFTGAVMDGHRVRGRTFLVPLSGIAYDGAGALSDATQTTISLAAVGLVTAATGNLSVWHRPKFGPVPVGGGARPLIRPGGQATVTSSSVPKKMAVLRSRRD
jgi:hypothetical protein